jgi:gliding motility-associated-like protein
MKTLQLIWLSILLSVNAVAQNSDNVGFEFGDFTNWDAYTGRCCGGTFSYSGPLNGRHTIVKDTGFDLNSNNTISYLAPDGGNYSVRLGNSNVGSEAERLSTSFMVTSDNANLTYMYAVILEDPPMHPYNDKPKFEIRILDEKGNQIPGPCGNYKVTAGFDTDGWEQLGDIRYKNWTKVTVDLSQYIGKIMTIEFTTEDCGWSGHFGYAYIDADIGNSEIKVANFCKDADSITLSAPEGYVKYKWMPGGETTRSIIIRNPVPGDTFTVDLINEAGCNALLTNVLKQYDYPVIDHIPDTTICRGQSVCLKANARGQGITYYWSGYSKPMQKLCIKPDSATQLIVTARNKNNCFNEKSIDTVTVFVDNHMTFNLCCDGYLCRGDTVLLKSPIKSSHYEWSDTALPPNTIHDSFGYFIIRDESPISLKVWDVVCSYQSVVHFKFPVDSITTFYFCDGDSDIRFKAPNAKTWLWSHNGDTTQSSIVHDPQDSQYIYVNLDTLKCSNMYRILLIKNKEIIPVLIVPKDTFLCSGNQIKLTGYDAAKPGRVGYWYTDNSCCFPNGTIIYPLKNIQYYYRINGNCKVSNVDTFRITIDSQAFFKLDKNIFTCFGDSVTLDPKVNSGSFIWSSYPLGFNSSDSVIRIKPLNKTIYFLTHYLKGCSFTASTTLDFYKRPDKKIINYCETSSPKLTLSADKKYNNFHWDPTNDTTSFTTINLPTLLKEVRLHCTLENGCKDTIYYLLNKLNVPIIQGPNDTMICINGTINPDVKGKKSGYHYYWNNTDSSFYSTQMNPIIQVAHSDWYKIRVTNESDCYGSGSIDSFFVSFDYNVIPVFGKDTSICQGKSVKLAPLSGKGNFHWSSIPPGFSATSKYIIVTPKVQTKYILTISDNKCKGNPNGITVFFLKKDTLYIPNIFTPNDDGINDVFKITTHNYEAFNLNIFNRWGQKVFFSNTDAISWDGMFDGTQAPDGVYFYTLEIKTNCEDINNSGTISLYR